MGELTPHGEAMKSGGSAGERRRHFLRQVVLGVVFLNLTAIGFGTTSLYSSYREETREAELRTRNLAEAADKAISALVDKVDVALRNVADELEQQLKEGAIEKEKGNAFIARQLKRMSGVDGIRVADDKGDVILGPGTAQLPLANYADRDFFAFHRDHSNSGLIVTEPIIGRISGKWILSFNRRFNRPDGSFAGVVSASITIPQLRTHLASFDMGSQGLMTIRSLDDLSLVIRHPEVISGQSLEIGNKVVSKELRDAVASGITGSTYHALTPYDGTERVLTWHRLEKAPFIVVAGLAKNDYLSSWRNERNIAIVLLLAFLFLSSLGARLLWLAFLNTHREIERNRLLLRSASDGIVVLDAHGNVIEASDSFCNMLGYSRDEMIGMNVSHWDATYTAAELQAMIDSHLADRETRCFQVRHRRRDGSELDAEIIAHAVEMDGQLVLFDSVRDITERKLAEQQLAQELALRQQIQDSIPGIFYIIDANDHLLMWNRGAEALLGLTAEELGQRNPMTLFAEEDRDAVAAGIRQVLTTGTAAVEGRLLCAHGRRVPFLLNGYRFLMDGKSVIIGVGIDISELKATQAELERHQLNLEGLVAARTRELAAARDAAEAANVAKTAFLANMSHEIRTPLNAILGMAHLLRQSDVTAEQDDHLRKIDTAGHHLLEIINTILDLSKIDAGKLTLEEEPLDVGAIAANVASILALPAQSKNVQILVEGEQLPANLLGDCTPLQQGLLNYANNAIKFTSTGKITLRFRKLEETEHDVLVCLEVEDTGIGIPPEKLKKLFSPFEQGDNSITREYGGTGLGLAITKRFAELMGGDAGAFSVPGKGSTFWLSARLRKGSCEPAVQEVPLTGDSAKAILKRDFGHCRLLVVEDEPVNREIMLLLFRPIWPAVEVAEDGLGAVAMVETTRYDLILMDMQMPRMDGLEATRRIRHLANGATTPIIATTANAFVEDRAQCSAAGMDDFVAKPVNPDQLFAQMLKWLQRGRQAPATGE